MSSFKYRSVDPASINSLLQSYSAKLQIIRVEIKDFWSTDNNVECSEIFQLDFPVLKELHFILL